MFTLASEADLVASFRPKDQRGLELEPGVQFPLTVEHYFAWRHPAGGKVFLVFATPGGVPTGIAFDSNGAVDTPAMCDWCHQTASGNGVGFLMATVNGRKRVGVHLCVDLSCQQKIEEHVNRLGMSLAPAMKNLVARMGRFASEGLQIDLQGANR